MSWSSSSVRRRLKRERSDMAPLWPKAPLAAWCQKSVNLCHASPVFTAPEPPGCIWFACPRTIGLCQVNPPEVRGGQDRGEGAPPVLSSEEDLGAAGRKRGPAHRHP